MNKTDQVLTITYIISLLFMVCFSLFFEVVRPDLIGIFFDNDDRSFCTIMESISIILSLTGVYGGLKLLSISHIAHECKNEKLYLSWSLRRWGMVFVPMVLCLFTYYLFFSTNVVAFLGIGAICLLFVWPTRERREREMNVFNEES